MCSSCSFIFPPLAQENVEESEASPMNETPEEEEVSLDQSVTESIASLLASHSVGDEEVIGQNTEQDTKEIFEDEPLEESVEKSVEESVEESVQEPVQEPVQKPVEEVVQKPMQEPTLRSLEELQAEERWLETALRERIEVSRRCLLLPSVPII